MPRRKGPGGARKGAGRPSLGQDARSIIRSMKLTPAEAAAHDAARGDMPWSDWMREAAQLAIARGSTR